MSWNEQSSCTEELMARTPNYNFERKERERLKAEKKAEKLAAKAARKQNEAADEAADDAAEEDAGAD